MRAMILERPRSRLVLREVETPIPAPGQVRVRVRARAVCRTDLHVVTVTSPSLRCLWSPGTRSWGPSMRWERASLDSCQHKCILVKGTARRGPPPGPPAEPRR